MKYLGYQREGESQVLIVIKYEYIDRRFRGFFSIFLVIFYLFLNYFEGVVEGGYRIRILNLIVFRRSYFIFIVVWRYKGSYGLLYFTVGLWLSQS